MVLGGTLPRRGARAIAAAVALATGSMGARAETPAATADVEGKSESAFFPLPMYTTVPTEGSTYGFMPVFLKIAPTGAVRSILAPSLSWNPAPGLNATFRYYRYPERTTSWSVIAAAALRVNRSLWLQYDRFPRQPGRATLDVTARVRRNLFYRFFGLGPESRPEDESSYTRLTALFTARPGINLPLNFNAGVRFTLRGDWPERRTIFGLPALQDVHPDAPGLDGAAMAALGVSLRYDNREEGDYALTGVAVELSATGAHGLRGFAGLLQLAAHARALWRETSFLQGGARLYWNHLADSRDVPFYYQSALGGEILLRGYPDDRFIDRGAWELELEQRIRLLRTHFFHVTTDWRVDPFVAVGQVYDRFARLVSHPRLAAGLGFRAWVHPNVLGRVDVAYASEGLRAYVVLGYPF
jgi:hypothetical protein